MVLLNSPQDLTRLRRLALNAQGLLKSQHFGSSIKGVRAAIHHIGYVQIDTISVVERAHNHILFSRVPRFKPEMLNQMLLRREIFEYWSHAAAFLPMSDYRFSLPYKHTIKSGQTHWYRDPDKKLMAELLARIRSDGPLRSRDLETNSTKHAGWWDWKPAKKAIEQLYMQGDLMVSNREGFQKTYDLTERVLPTNISAKMPSTEEFAQHIVDQQLRCHGLVSVKGIAYKRRNTDLRKAVKAFVEEQLAEGILEQIQLASGEIFILKTAELERSTPRLNRRLSILSPFDNSVIQRDRLKALFQFDYQLECYVTASKRQYGYFSLPLLYGDEFIGVMDCKAHRKNHHFEIKSLYIKDHTFKEDALISAFVKSIKQFCKFQNCETISLIQVQPKKLTKALQQALVFMNILEKSE